MTHQLTPERGSTPLRSNQILRQLPGRTRAAQEVQRDDVGPLAVPESELRVPGRC